MEQLKSKEVPDAAELKRQREQLESDLDAAVKNPAAKQQDLLELFKRADALNVKGQTTERIATAVVALSGRSMDTLVTLPDDVRPVPEFWQPFIETLQMEIPPVTARDVKKLDEQVKARTALVELRKALGDLIFFLMVKTTKGRITENESGIVVRNARKYVRDLDDFMKLTGQKQSPELVNVLALAAKKQEPKKADPPKKIEDPKKGEQPAKPKDDPKNPEAQRQQLLIERADALTKKIAAMKPADRDATLKEVQAFYKEFEGEVTPALFQAVLGAWPDRIEANLAPDPSVKTTPEFWTQFMTTLRAAVPVPTAKDGPLLRVQAEAQGRLVNDQTILQQHLFQRILLEKPLDKDGSERVRRNAAWYLRDLRAYQVLLDPRKEPTVVIPDFLTKLAGAEAKDAVSVGISAKMLNMQYDVDPQPRKYGPIAAEVGRRIIDRKDIKLKDVTVLAGAPDDAIRVFLDREKGKLDYAAEKIDADLIRSTRLFVGYLQKRVPRAEKRLKPDPKTGKMPDIQELSVAEVMQKSNIIGLGEFTEEFGVAFKLKLENPNPIEFFSGLDFAEISRKTHDRLGLGTGEVVSVLSDGLINPSDAKDKIIVGDEERLSGVAKFIEFINSGKAKETPIRVYEGATTNLPALTQRMLKNLSEYYLAKPAVTEQLLKNCFLPETNTNEKELRKQVGDALREVLEGGMCNMHDAFELYNWLEGPSKVQLLCSAKVVEILKRNGKVEEADDLQAYLFKVISEMAEKGIDSIPGLDLDLDAKEELKNFAKWCEEEGIDKLFKVWSKVRAYAERYPWLVSIGMASFLVGPWALKTGAKLTLKYGGATALKGISKLPNVVGLRNIPGLGMPYDYFRTIATVAEFASMKGDPAKIEAFIKKHNLDAFQQKVLMTAIGEAADITTEISNLPGQWLHKRLLSGKYFYERGARRLQAMNIRQAAMSGDFGDIARAFRQRYPTPELLAERAKAFIGDRATMEAFLTEAGFEADAKRVAEEAIQESVSELREALDTLTSQSVNHVLRVRLAAGPAIDHKALAADLRAFGITKLVDAEAALRAAGCPDTEIGRVADAMDEYRANLKKYAVELYAKGYRSSAGDLAPILDQANVSAQDAEIVAEEFKRHERAEMRAPATGTPPPVPATDQIVRDAAQLRVDLKVDAKTDVRTDVRGRR